VAAIASGVHKRLSNGTRKPIASEPGIRAFREAAIEGAIPRTGFRAFNGGKGGIMSRIRHIAIIVPDAEEAAKFYEQALGLKRAGTARRGIYMSDGVINIALLTKEHENEKLGLYHFGVWVDDLDASEKKVVDAGGTYLAGRPTSPNSFYEAKYRDPNGVVFDLTHHGWAGATKDVVAKT
jgi:lactoylglutathione lyase